MFMIDMDNHHNFFLMVVEGRCPGLLEAHFYAIQFIELAKFLLDKMTMIAVEQNKDQRQITASTSGLKIGCELHNTH